MSLRAAGALHLVIRRFDYTRPLSAAHCRSYSESKTSSSKAPFQLDPLLADVLASYDTLPLVDRPHKETTLEPPPKFELPPSDEWRAAFPNTSTTHHRISIRNPDSAYKIADAFVPKGSLDKVVIEAFPGPGQLTRALLRLPKERVKKIIVMEDNEQYLEYLRPLEQADPRVKILPIAGYEWDSYQTIENLNLLDDVPKLEWTDGVHPQLQFMSHLPSTVIGEQLIAQLFRGIPDSQWLFQYGRVPMSFILSEYVWKRVSAGTDQTTARCKLSVIAEAVADCKEALSPDALQPFGDHFHPVPSTLSSGPSAKRGSRRVGNPFQAINVVPLEHQSIEKGKLDQWDYCLRRLFVRKATPIKGALSSLAPGAQNLLKEIGNPNLPDEERLDVKKLVRQLTVSDWSKLLKAFDEWSFAPEDLSIGDNFMKEMK